MGVSLPLQYKLFGSLIPYLHISATTKRWHCSRNCESECVCWVPGSRLLSADADGQIKCWGMAEHLVNGWESSLGSAVEGDPIVALSWLHNGVKLALHVEKVGRGRYKDCHPKYIEIGTWLIKMETFTPCQNYENIGVSLRVYIGVCVQCRPSI